MINQSSPPDTSTATTPASAATPTQVTKLSPTKIQNIVSSPKCRLYEEIIEHHFPSLSQLTNNRSMDHLLLAIFSQYTPFAIKSNEHLILVHPEKKMAVCDDFDAVLTIYRQHDIASLNLMFTLYNMDDHAFEQALVKMQQKNLADMMVLNTLLWQIYDAMLPQTITYTYHQLQLKVKYMPNFSMMHDVPSHLNHVLAVCLKQPKTLHDLQCVFDDIAPEKLNKFFLIAILADVADVEVLQMSHKNALSLSQKNKQNSDAMDKSTVINGKQKEKEKENGIDKQQPKFNMGVKKALKNNFFRRMLRKLSF